MNGFFLTTAFALSLFSCTMPHRKVADKNITPLSSANRKAQSVYLTKTNSDGVAIGWTEQDTTPTRTKYFYYAVFNQESKRLADSIRIPIAQHAALHAEGMPKIALKPDGTIMAVYEVKVESANNPYAGEIHYIVSYDDGQTWSAPQPVHANRQPDQSRSFFDVATLPSGEIGVSWLGESLPNEGRPVLFAHTDSTNAFVNECIVDNMACECCRTALYADESGLISIVYRDIIDSGIRDISVVTSANGGRTFSQPICFSGDDWNINGCPHNGPDVVSDDKFIYATWFTGGTGAGVYFARLDNEHVVTAKELVSEYGRTIQITRLGKGTNMLVYSEDVETEEGFSSEIKALIKPTNQQIQVSNKRVDARTPVAMGMGNQHALVAWIEKAGQLERVYYKLISLD